MAAVPSIPEFYAGQKIFITGGTGFMGKVLIEKLLRSCPDLHTIYLLIRPKKGKPPQDRIQDITRQALFDTIRRDEPRAFDKLRAVAGDVKELGLGLSAEDKEMLQREVSIVFHSAASVRFDEPLNDAVLMNVRGTREVVNLAMGMEKLKVFLHLSTSFSNSCDQGHVEEKMYPPPCGWDWKTAIRLAEMEGTHGYVDCLTPKILGPLFANTYLFAKALGEQIINDYRDKLPLVIVRPSVVICAFDPPLKGWVEHMNGLYALWTGVYTGVLRLIYTTESIIFDFVPVDVAVKSIVVIAWHRAVVDESYDKRVTPEVPIYNCTSMMERKNQKIFNAEMGRVAHDHPTEKMIWYPECTYTENWVYSYVNLLLFHVTYGCFLDALLKYNDMKPMFVKIYRQVLLVKQVGDHFYKITYTFDNTKFLRLADDMLVSDRKEFGYTGVRKFDAETYKTMILAGRVNLLHDPMETMAKAKKTLVRLYWLDRVVKGASCLALFWALTTTNAFHAVTAFVFH